MTLPLAPTLSSVTLAQAELQQVAEALRQSTKQLCRNLKDNPNVAENMAKVASERQSLQLLISNTLTELDGYRKVQPIVESVLAQEVAEVQMKQTIEHERTTTAAVRQLRNDLKDEKIDHEEKMREKKKMVVALKEQLKEMKMTSAVDIRFVVGVTTKGTRKGCMTGICAMMAIEDEVRGVNPQPGTKTRAAQQRTST